MKTKMLIWTLLVLIWVPSRKIMGQEKMDSTRYLVETIDGNAYQGYMISRDSVHLRLMTETLGELNIPVSNIAKISNLTGLIIKDGKLWTDNPQATRHFWSPNGYGLKAGEAYYQNIWVFFNQFVVGVTNNFSIGAGIVPLFLFAGGPTPAWVTPKISIPVVKEKLNVGAGALVGAVIGQKKSGFGILYGTTTFGSKNSNVSVGFGYGFVSGDWAKEPMINVSALFRASARAYFITENYYIPANGSSLLLFSAGGRSVIRGNVSIDYGLIMPLSEDLGGFVAFPWLGVTVPIGKGK